MAKEREFSCTIAAPSIINFENHCICQCNVNGHFPIRHWLTLQASDHIPRKCEIWKHEDYHMKNQSIIYFTFCYLTKYQKKASSTELVI